MAIRTKSRGLVYLRRSGDRQESSLQSQLEWALAEAQRYNVAVDAHLDDIESMRSKHLTSYKSIRMDDAVSGSELDRDGLNALVEDVHDDRSVSHIFVYRRDRLGRPNSPLDMMVIEASLLQLGVTIVRSDGLAEPSADGDVDIAEHLKMLLDYHASGDFLKQLSERIIRTQLQLAAGGHWTGGRPPYGFVRVLVDSQGNVLEELPEGKRVRQAGCHVVIMPKDEEKIACWIYILELKEKGWGYKRITKLLNERGVLSPGAGTVRTDHGVQHEVSGRWNQTTVRSLCRNRAIVGLLDYGRRSEGKHRRLGDGAPRRLDESDQDAGSKPKRVFNDPSRFVVSELPDGGQFDRQRWEKIDQETSRRGKSQAGIPRARNPGKYPLS